jgi:hypothetical protein
MASGKDFQNSSHSHDITLAFAYRGTNGNHKTLGIANDSQDLNHVFSNFVRALLLQQSIWCRTVAFVLCACYTTSYLMLQCSCTTSWKTFTRLLTYSVPCPQKCQSFFLFDWFVVMWFNCPAWGWLNKNYSLCVNYLTKQVAQNYKISQHSLIYIFSPIMFVLSDGVALKEARNKYIFQGCEIYFE